MKTKVYAQWEGASGLDARYMGTINLPPKETAKRLLSACYACKAKVVGPDVIIYGRKPLH